MAETKNGDSLESRGIFMFTGDVDDDLCSDAIEFIMKENFSGKNDKITMIVNSHGGSMTSGFSVIDVMKGSKIPVRTIGLGILASMGLHIFISGKKGERVLTPNTLIMSHQWTWGTYGKEHELLASMKSFDLVTEMQIRHYRKIGRAHV